MLEELKDISCPVAISLEEMLTLMNQCKELVDVILYITLAETRKTDTTDRRGRGIKNILPY